MTGPSEPVEVINWLGRHFLKVLGVVMVGEGDVLRDCNVDGVQPAWTEVSLGIAERSMTERLSELTAAAREEGRKTGIEQAADEAVLHTHRVCRGDAARMRKCPICRTKAEVAADIRALAETKPQENDDDER